MNICNILKGGLSRNAEIIGVEKEVIDSIFATDR